MSAMQRIKIQWWDQEVSRRRRRVSWDPTGRNWLSKGQRGASQAERERARCRAQVGQVRRETGPARPQHRGRGVWSWMRSDRKAGWDLEGPEGPGKGKSFGRWYCRDGQTLDHARTDNSWFLLVNTIYLRCMQVALVYTAIITYSYLCLQINLILLWYQSCFIV